MVEPGKGVYRSVMALIFIVNGFLLLAGAGCTQKLEDDTIVAEVGNLEFSLADVKEARDRLGSTDIRLDRVLQLLIDRELLLLEARKQNLDADEWVVAEMAQVWNRMAPRLYEAAVAEQIHITYDEAKAYYDTSRMSTHKEVGYRQIVVADMDAAREMVRLLAEGADFGELAREHSLDSTTAARGGDLGYLEHGRHFGTIPQIVYPLDVGGVAEPFRGPDGRYYLLQKTEENLLGFDRQREAIETLLTRQRIRETVNHVLDSLFVERQGVVDPTAANLLLLRVKGSDERLPILLPSEKSMPLCVYHGGRFTLGDYAAMVAHLPPSSRPAFIDHAGVKRFVQRLITVSVFLNEYLDDKGDQYNWEHFYQNYTQRRDALMITALRRREVENRVLTHDVVEAYYQQQGKALPGRPFITVEMVQDECIERIQSLQRQLSSYQLDAFVDMVDQDTYVVLHIGEDELNEELYQPVASVLQGMQPGDISEPIEFQFSRDQIPAYTVVRILRRADDRAETAPLSTQAQIIESLKQDKAEEIEELFEEYLDSLRSRYSDIVNIAHSGLRG